MTKNSVFTAHQEQNSSSNDIQHKNTTKIMIINELHSSVDIKFEAKEGEKLYCKNAHSWKNQVPEVDKNILSIQNQHLMGLPCDCGRMIYSEGECGCFNKQWEIKMLEK